MCYLCNICKNKCYFCIVSVSYFYILQLKMLCISCICIIWLQSFCPGWNGVALNGRRGAELLSSQSSSLSSGYCTQWYVCIRVQVIQHDYTTFQMANYRKMKWIVFLEYKRMILDTPIVRVINSSSLSKATKQCNMTRDQKSFKYLNKHIAHTLHKHSTYIVLLSVIWVKSKWQ